MEKLETIQPEDMAETQFTGICVVEIMGYFVKAVKTLRLVPIEFLVKEIEET